LHTLPASHPLPAWVAYLRDELPPDAAIACLPFPEGTWVDHYALETEWMYWSMFHQHPLLNGYSGYFPKTYITLRDEVLNFPDQGVPQLRELGADYVVIQRSFASEPELRQHPATRDWIWQFSDEVHQIDIYSLPEVKPPVTALRTQVKTN
jgi:hypothetical protein